MLQSGPLISWTLILRRPFLFTYWYSLGPSLLPLRWTCVPSTAPPLLGILQYRRTSSGGAYLFPYDKGWYHKILALPRSSKSNLWISLFFLDSETLRHLSTWSGVSLSFVELALSSMSTCGSSNEPGSLICRDVTVSHSSGVFPSKGFILSKWTIFGLAPWALLDAKVYFWKYYLSYSFSADIDLSSFSGRSRTASSLRQSSLGNPELRAAY